MELVHWSRGLVVWTHWVALVQWLTVLLQCVEKFDIVLGFIGKISDGHIQFTPFLLGG